MQGRTECELSCRHDGTLTMNGGDSAKSPPKTFPNAPQADEEGTTWAELRGEPKIYICMNQFSLTL